MNIKEKLLKLNYAINNEWLDKYCNLVSNDNSTDKLTNTHHIIPKHYYTENDIEVDNSSENLVKLSFSDHILAHYYLYKCSQSREHQRKNLSAIFCMLNYINIRCNEYTLDNIIGNLNDVNDLYKDYINLLSEWASSRKGVDNPFWGKTFSDESKAAIGKANSKQVIMTKDDSSITFSSIKDCLLYLRNIGIVSTIRPIVKAAKNDTLLYDARWKILDNGHKKQTFSDEGRSKLITNAEKRGTHLQMVSKNGDIITFTSLYKAGTYIKEHNLDSLHPKNIGRKIKNAANNNEELYNCKWKIIKV